MHLKLISQTPGWNEEQNESGRAITHVVHSYHYWVRDILKLRRLSVCSLVLRPSYVFQRFMAWVRG